MVGWISGGSTAGERAIAAALVELCDEVAFLRGKAGESVHVEGLPEYRAAIQSATAADLQQGLNASRADNARLGGLLREAERSIEALTAERNELQDRERSIVVLAAEVVELRAQRHRLLSDIASLAKHAGSPDT
jgi:hypothetical protein